MTEQNFIPILRKDIKRPRVKGWVKGVEYDLES